LEENSSMDAIEALKTRRSVRAYIPKPIPKEVIEDLIDCARFAPTARGVEPWEFVVMTQPALLRWLSQTADYGQFIVNAAACIAVLCKETKYYLEDGCAATENILVAACAHGLGSCWVAGDKKPYAPAVCRQVGAPEGYRLISLVALGYPAETPKATKRPVSQMLHWEKF
jgi:nitroreductase